MIGDEPNDVIIGSGPNIFDCSPYALTGNFIAGLEISDTKLILNIDVNTLETYDISTETINGYKFTATGTFTELGSQKLNLIAEGMPIEQQIDDFTVYYGDSSCDISVTVKFDDNQLSDKVLLIAPGERFSLYDDPYYLYAVNSQGTLVWSNRVVTNKVAINDNILYAATGVYNGVFYDNFLKAYNVIDGSEIWSTSIDFSVTSDTVLVDNVIYLSTNNGTLVAYDALTGNFKWKFNSGTIGFINSNPVINNGYAYFGFYESDNATSSKLGVIYALDITSGNLAWKYTKEGFSNSFRTPQVFGEMLISTSKGKVIALNSDDGSLFWELNIEEDEYLSEATYSDDKVYFFSETKLFVVDAINGNVLWSMETLDEQYIAPLIYEGKVFVKVFQGIQAIDINSQDVIWTNSNYVYANDTPTVFKDVLYISTNNGLWAINSATGQKVWSYGILSANSSDISITYKDSQVAYEIKD